MTRKTTIFALLLLGASLASMRPAIAFLWDRHAAITETALPFVTSNVMGVVVAANNSMDVDQVFWHKAEYHFDNCTFEESSDRIQTLYDRAISALRPGHVDPAVALGNFGKLLHPVQDFYSHSNWVELEAFLGMSGLVENSLGQWPSMRPYTIGPGLPVRVAEGDGHGNPRPTIFDPTASGDAFFFVDMHDGQPALPALISGDTSGMLVETRPHKCPTNATLSHDQLNKDGKMPGSRAYNRAVQQTQHEWCRLLNLTKTTWRIDALIPLFDAAVDASQTQSAVSACGALLLPTLTGFGPSNGSPGDTVTVNGSNFTADSIATFNGSVATITARSDQTLTVAVPPDATTGPITVKTRFGTATSSNSFVVTMLVPPVPSNFRAVPLSSTQVLLSWTDTPNETYYEIGWGPSYIASTFTVPAGTTSYLFSDLDSGTSYHFDIRAVNGAGASAWHGVIGCTPSSSC